MRNTLLLLLSLLFCQISWAQSLGSVAVEEAFKKIIALEQEAYFDSAAQAYRALRSQLRKEQQEETSNRVTYKIGYCLIRAGHYAKAKDSLLFGIKDMLNRQDSSYLHIVSSYNELGTCAWYAGNLDEAEKYYQISLKLGLKHPERLKNRIKVASFNLALMNSRRGNYKEAIATFQAIIARLQEGEMTANDTLTLANAWINIGAAYNGMGDFTRSLKYHRLGLEGHRYYYGDNHPQLGNDLTNIGQTLEVLKRFEEALPYHHEALKLQRSRLGDEHPFLANTYLNLGATYEGLGQLDSSRYYALKALSLYEIHREKNDYDFLLCLNNLAELAYVQKDYEQAKRYHQRAVEQAGEESIEEVYGEALVGLGLDYWALGDSIQGRRYLDAGIAELRRSSLDGSLSQSIFKPSLLGAFGNYAGGIHEHGGASVSNMKEILALVDSGQLVLYGARLSDIAAASREAMSKNGKDLLALALETTYELNAVEPNAELIAKAFRYAENKKAAALYDQLRFVEALEFSDVPESFKTQERQLKAKITLLREDLYYEQNELGSEAILELRNEIDRYELKYDSLLNKLEELYPRYYQIQHGNYIAGPQEIQAELPSGSAMLVYSLTETSIIIWQIEAEETRMLKLVRPDSLIADVKRFRDAAENPDVPYAQFLALSKNLFQALMAEPLAYLGEEVKSLIIVPDGALSVLPFELLSLRGTPSSFQDIEYLFEDYAISYAYSASVFLEQLEAQSAPSQDKLFGGFAANYTEGSWGDISDSAMLGALVRDGELPLPAARKEVEYIASLLKGDAFLDALATESNFTAKTEDYAILHLAMHALLDDQNPMYSKLIFSPGADSASDGLLTAAELYNLNIPAQLAVLSACNTGYGKILAGEGVMSLSRAFAYAGCPSTLMSLWRVPDQATSELMFGFYQSLAAGKSKAEALREAKLKYLAEVKSTSLAHPFYWAGFVQMGNPLPIQKRSIGDKIESALIAFGDYAWGYPLLIILLGGGLFFLVFSRLLPYRYLGHAIQILRGKYDSPDDPGDINHYQALSTALAATVGMGNISGVAVAIVTGGPGAIFWMWLSALVGVATKFFTCTLAIMYRGRDTDGNLQGGPMYVITEGMGTQWKPMATFFSLAGLIGCLPLFQANQLTATIQDVLLSPAGIANTWQSNAIIGLIISLLVAAVMFGGIKRIGAVAGRMVPFMVVLYLLAVAYILIVNVDQIIPSFQLIFKDAFTGSAVMGGALGSLILTGVRRAAFSNEAGIGTAPMAHGAAKTKEPVREGLIAMLGPIIDTVLVCTLTALAIIISGVWKNGETEGITVTLQAFESAMPGLGSWVLTLCVLVFSLTTLFTYSYYGTKCLNFLAGAKYQKYYQYFYVISIVFGAVATLDAALALIDGMYALMTIPTVLSAVYLSPRVYKAAKTYFANMNT